jgi:hypothetical protein
MLANGPVERFSLADIAERDGWRCGICEDPVDPSYRAPDPRTPSIDHIKPIVRGGTETRDNVRLTHLFCNMNNGIMGRDPDPGQARRSLVARVRAITRPELR